MTASRTARPSRAALTPAALAERLGVAEWQVHRAERDHILPPRDRSKGWSASLADDLVVLVEDRRAEFIRDIGTVPDMATWDTLAHLTARFPGIDIHADTVREFWHRGRLTVKFWDREYPIFDGRTIEALLTSLSVEELAEAEEKGRTLTSDQAAERLQIRRVDFDHAVRAGLIRARRRVLTGYTSKRYDPGMLLFTVGAVDELGALPEPGGVSWELVRGLRRGQRSPWAKLPDAPRRSS